MTQEDKGLLIKDLCARLPYGVKVEIISYGQETLKPWFGKLSCKDLDCFIHNIAYKSIKPYLRPMSSMTSQEWCELCDCDTEDEKAAIYIKDGRRFVSHVNKETFLNSRHFDYRGLIPMGLALEAPKDMYKKI